MGSFFQRPAIRRIRTVFRWCRIVVWMALLLVVAFIAYFHMIGLPDFLKKPLLDRLLASDIVAQFSNLQLGWRHGPTIIIDNASFARADQALSPRLSTSRAELVLDAKALRRGKIHAKSLDVVNAELRVPVSETNGDTLSLNNVLLDMRFDTNDIVRVMTCRGVFRGMQIDIIGGVTHVKDMRKWKLFAGTAAGGTGAVQAKLREFARGVQEVHFTGVPVLQIEAGADGLDINSFHAEMNFGVAAVETPWGTVTNLTLNAACARLANPGSQPFFHATGSADILDTPWVQGRRVSFSTTMSRLADSNLNALVHFDTREFNAPWQPAGDHAFGANHLWWDGRLTMASSNQAPFLASGHVRAIDARTPWGTAERVSLDCRANRATNAPEPRPSWAFWSDFAPWNFTCEVQVTNVVNPRMHFDRLSFVGHWNAPEVTVDRLEGRLYGGNVAATAHLDIDSRELRSNGKTDFDPHVVKPLLRRQEQLFLEQLEWTAPPRVNATVRLVLPPWTNRPPDWSKATEASLQIAGNFTAGPSAFTKVKVQSAKGQVTFTNGIWHVAQLHVVRPDGAADLDYTTSEAGFHYIIDSKMDPKAALPLIMPGKPHLLDQFEFHQAPEVHAQIWGSWRDPGRTGVIGTVCAGDFTFRGESINRMAASVKYTNFVLETTEFSLSNALCQASLPWLRIDFRTRAGALTNAIGVVDPRFIADLLKPNVPDWLNAVRFDTPPSVQASGVFYLTNSEEADLHFMVSANGAHYTNLVADHASATVNWTGRTVTVTNITGSLYHGGNMLGWITFPGGAGRAPDFQADFTARNIDLSALAAGVSHKTNHLEGRLDADLFLTGPNSANRLDWEGRGRVHVYDGLLWDIKIFGIFSPVLNLISPGWGHSRAKEAAADFLITNGVVGTDDLIVRCQGFRILMRGTLDRTNRVNARMEARLSRETPVIGSFLSAAFMPLSKLFEYRVSGPVNDPTLEPIYVPKFVMFMLRPFHSLKSMTTPEPKEPPPAGK